MKMNVRSIAFAMLLVPTTLVADSVEVTFDAALTNTTEWTYMGNVKTNKNGNFYINGHDVRITSPSYNFVITSIVMRVSTSGSCTRNLIISSCDNETISLPQEFTNIPQGTSSDITATWNIADRVRTLAITSTSGAQNLYFHSAVISGVPLIEAPTDLQADDIKGTRCRLSWNNPANAVSNRIDVSRVVNHEMAGDVLDEYDFAEFANSSGNPTNRTDDFIAQYPDFAGSSLIYIPAHTAGNIQISTDNQKGFLVHSGLSDCSAVTLLLSLKIPNSEQGKTFGIGYETAAGTTNEVAAIPLDLEFKTNRISIAEIPADTPIIFNTQGANSKRRVVIDYLAFVHDYGPAYAETNLVKTVFASDGEKTVRGLTPNSSYVVQVSAFGAEGNISPLSPPLTFETNNSGLPLVIKLQ